MRLKRRLVEQVMVGLLLGIMVLRFWLLSDAGPSSDGGRYGPPDPSESKVPSKTRAARKVVHNPFSTPQPQVYKPKPKKKKPAASGGGGGGGAGGGGDVGGGGGGGKKGSTATNLGAFSSARIHTGAGGRGVGGEELEGTERGEDDNPIPLAFRKGKKRDDSGYDPFQDEEVDDGSEGAISEGGTVREDGEKDEAEAEEEEVVATPAPAKKKKAASSGQPAVIGELKDDEVETLMMNRENDEMEDMLSEDGFDEEPDEDGWSEEEIAKQARIAKEKARLAAAKDSESRHGTDAMPVDKVLGQWGRVETRAERGPGSGGGGGPSKKRPGMTYEEMEEVDPLAANLLVATQPKKTDDSQSLDFGVLNSDWERRVRKGSKARGGGFQGSLDEYKGGAAMVLNGVVTKPSPPPPPKPKPRSKKKKHVQQSSFLDTVEMGSDQMSEEYLDEPPSEELEAALAEGQKAPPGMRMEDAAWTDQEEDEAEEARPKLVRPDLKMRTSTAEVGVKVEQHITKTASANLRERVKHVRETWEEPPEKQESGLEKIREVDDE